VVAGSSPGTIVGFALLELCFLRLFTLKLPVEECREKGEWPMKETVRCAGVAVLETMWSVGASTVAGALPT